MVEKKVFRPRWEGVWSKKMIEMYRYDQEGRPMMSHQEYSIPERSLGIDVGIYFGRDELGMVLIPYKLEHFRIRPYIEGREGLVEELFMGIMNDSHVDYIGKIWIPKKRGEPRVQSMNGKVMRDLSLKYVNPKLDRYMEQYFFEDGKPSGARIIRETGFGGPSWPTNRPVVIGEKLKSYFEDFIKIVPELKKEVRSAVQKLAVPGPRERRRD